MKPGQKKRIAAINTVSKPALSECRNHCYRHKKCGLMVMELTVKVQRQETLFDDVDAGERAAKTMAVMDSINRVWGRGTLRSGAADNSKRWAMRSENRSPRYTTQWEELPVAP